MVKNSIKFFGVFLTAGLLLTACANPLNRPAAEVDSGLTVSDPQLVQAYEDQVKSILAPFWSAQTSTGIKAKILELRAPTQYLDLHLQLVLAFGLLEQGQQTADQAKIEEGLGQLNQLKVAYPWLE